MNSKRFQPRHQCPHAILSHNSHSVIQQARICSADTPHCAKHTAYRDLDPHHSTVPFLDDFVIFVKRECSKRTHTGGPALHTNMTQQVVWPPTCSNLERRGKAAH